MSKSAFSLLVFSIYEFALGVLLVVAPNLLLTFFGFPETHEVWVRTGYVCGGPFGSNGQVPPQEIIDQLGQPVTKPSQPEIAAKLRELEDLIHETQKERL